jgi:hypothetical protein
MKKYIEIAVTGMLLCFAACSSPLLKWIEIDEPPAAPRIYAASDKAITAFSFGLAGETDVIRASAADPAAPVPITVVLPAGSVVTNLSPAVTFIGKSLSPPSGAAGNFSAPIDYRVFAEDGSFRDYQVTVIVKNPQDASIIWFDLEIPQSGDYLMAEGVVTEGQDGQPGDIVIHVPSGVSLDTPLTAKIVQTGTLTAGGGSFSETAVTMTGDFSSPALYRVTPENGPAKDYLVTVVRDKSKEKEITALAFLDGTDKAVTGAGPALIGAFPQGEGMFPIVVTVPEGTALEELKPVITHTGYSLNGAEVSAGGGPGTVTAADIVDFSGSDVTPVPYRVTAEDGSVREYAVTVLASGGNSTKQITGFYFLFPNPQGNQGAAGIINETAKTIVVTVPAGTNLGALAPVIYHTGASVGPLSGAPVNFAASVASPVPYTVTAKDGSTQTYMVTVFTADKSDKALTDFGFAGVEGGAAVIGTTPGPDGKLPVYVTVPDGTSIAALTPVITHTGDSLTGPQIPGNQGPGQVAAGGPVDFTSPVSFTVTAEDGTSQEYSVTVINPSAAGNDTARIDLFYFTSPPAIGAINQSAGTITVTVPADTNLNPLIPTISYTGSKIKLEGGADVEANPAHLGADFSGSVTTPVAYTVTAANNSTTKLYTVTVTRLPRTSREITAFSFTQITSPEAKAGTTTVIASTPNAAGKYPVDITVPAGTSLGALTPVIKHTGKTLAGDKVPTNDGPGEVTASGTVSFAGSDAAPVPYTVTAENGQTRDYLVTVRVDDNNVKKITGFYFANPAAVGVINEQAHTITVKVPYGTNLGNLTPTVYYTGFALDPVSGSPRSFSSPAVYRVTARNGTVQPYTVTVIPDPNNAKEITAFKFPTGVTVLDTVIGSVPGADGRVPIAVTVSPTTPSLANLTPAITHTGSSVSPGTGKAQDFSVPVFYTVTAADGSVKDYAVSVHLGGSPVITGFVFTPALNSSLTKPAVGAINQTEEKIQVVLPAGTALTGLKATVSYIGASLTPPGGTGQTANPFDDTSRDFTASKTYRVNTAVDGVYKEYQVTVVAATPNITVSYQGLSDPGLITDSYDQTTGILTLTIATDVTTTQNSNGYQGPYEWRLDGNKLAVSGTATALTLQTSTLEPGQHEIVLTAVGKDDGLHYTNKVYFLVGE